jgi:NAD(P)H-dependent FMN reductase
MAHDALLVASPENNASVSSLLKNVLDWLSRSIGDGKGDNSGLAPFRGKVAGMMTATPGNYGGVRGLPHLRQIFGALGVLVLPKQVQLARADHAFDDAGKLLDAKMAHAVEDMAKALAVTAEKLRGVYQNLGSRLQVQTRATEIAPMLAQAAALLVAMAAGLSMIWFGRLG